MNATLQMEAVNTVVLTPLEALTAAVTLGITSMEMDLTAVVRIYSISWIYTNSSYYCFNHTCAFSTYHIHFYFYADIDECESDDLNSCHENANCTNTEGSFHCFCNSGYTGDGVIICTSK